MPAKLLALMLLWLPATAVAREIAPLAPRTGKAARTALNKAELRSTCARRRAISRQAGVAGARRLKQTCLRAGYR